MDTRTAPRTQDGGPHGHAVHADTAPFVVSLDIVPLLTRWTTASNYQMPAPEVFVTLRSRMRSMLEGIFDHIEILDENDIRPHLLRLAEATKLPVISMDYAYCPVGEPLDVTRAVHSDMSNAGLTHRGICASIDEQVCSIATKLQGDVVLVDDVIFSGEMIARDVLPALNKHGITVRTVVAGIGIGDGIHRVREEVGDVRVVRTYGRVIDEICERDFYPGVPLSGRTVLGAGNVGMPYIRPFGDPTNWASIPPAHVERFSAFCIEQTIQLFEAIEKASDRPVRMRDLPRGVFSLPAGDERFVDELANSLKRV